jgi:peroxiredoxin
MDPEPEELGAAAGDLPQEVVDALPADVADGVPVAAGEGPAVPAGAGRSSGMGLTIALALVALAAGFLVGRKLFATAPVPAAEPPTAVAASSTAAIAAPADDAGLSVGVDFGEQVTVGKPAPEIRLRAPDGKPVALADFRGRPVLLNFFATWCGPCRVEMPHLEAAWKERTADGLVVLGVDVQEAPAVVPPFLDSLGLTFPVVVDADGEVSTAYRISILPTSYFIDRDGVVVREKVGFYNSAADLAADLKYVLPDAVTPGSG